MNISEKLKFSELFKALIELIFFYFEKQMLGLDEYNNFKHFILNDLFFVKLMDVMNAKITDAENLLDNFNLHFGALFDVIFKK